tara:strand:- start:38 stop:214 length:177 start_codon:yes stop_codon:yes gene_type:complete
MNKTNISKLWKMIQEAGDCLLGQLPSHPNHPKGRNPYAHVLCVSKRSLATHIKIFWKK